MKRAGRWLFNLAAGVALLLSFALAGWRIFGGHLQTHPYALLEYRGDGLEVAIDSGIKREMDYGVYLGPLRLDPIPLFVLLLILPVLWILLAAIHRVDSWDSVRQVRSGFCLVCGYDLRATPERCPECGTAVEKARTGKGQSSEAAAGA